MENAQKHDYNRQLLLDFKSEIKGFTILAMLEPQQLVSFLSKIC